MNMKIRSFLFFSCLFKYFSTFRFVPNFWSVVYTNQCRFKLLMFEEKTVSSCVNYRWVKSSDHERKWCVRNSGQQAREELKKTMQYDRKKKTKKKNVCVSILSWKRRKVNDQSARQAAAKWKQLLLLMTYRGRSLKGKQWTFPNQQTTCERSNSVHFTDVCKNEEKKKGKK